MDEQGLATFRRIRKSREFEPADKLTLLSLLERDYAVRSSRNGAASWFSVRAVDVAQENGSSAYRTNARIDAFIEARVLAKSMRDVRLGTRRLWFYHTEQTPPEDVGEIEDPQGLLPFAKEMLDLAAARPSKRRRRSHRPRRDRRRFRAETSGPGRHRPEVCAAATPITLVLQV